MNHSEKLAAIESILLNDENGTNGEIKEYFITELGCTPQEAAFYVSQRFRALKEALNFVLEEYTPMFPINASNLLLTKLDVISRYLSQVEKLWFDADELLDGILTTNYPFEYSFEEVVFKFDNWVKSIKKASHYLTIENLQAFEAALKKDGIEPNFFEELHDVCDPNAYMYDVLQLTGSLEDNLFIYNAFTDLWNTYFRNSL